MTEQKTPADQSLIALTLDYNRLMSLLVEAGGEVTPEIEAELAVNEAALSVKADRYDFIIEKLKTEESHWKLQADKYARVATACANARMRLREGIKATMITTGKTEIVGDTTTFYFKKSAPKLVIDDASKLADEWVNVTVVREPKKAEMLGALKDGLEIPGAHLEPVVALTTKATRKVK